MVDYRHWLALAGIFFIGLLVSALSDPGPGPFEPYRPYVATAFGLATALIVFLVMTGRLY